MSIEAVQHEISTWDDAQLRRLIAYAVVLQDRKSGRLPGDFAAKIDDPARWAPLDELDRRLNFRSDELAE
jgi:hypothetical protein